MLTFDPGPHEYRWHGKRVPSVTQALSLLTDYSRIPAAVLENARQEGVAMHRLVELHATNDLDEASLPAWMLPRLAAYKKFVADSGFAVIASEQLLYHPAYQYAGTADLFGPMRIRQGRKEILVEAGIDIKRSFYGGRAIGLQIAAYAEAWKAAGAPPVTHRYALQLRADSTYRLEPFDDKTDFAMFLSCLNVHRLKEQMQ